MGVVTWCRGGVGGPGTPVGAPRCWRRAAGHRRHPGPRSPPPASSPLRPASLPARAKWPPTGPSTTIDAGARRACCFPPRQSQGGLLDRGPVEAPRRRGCLPHGGDGEDRCRQTDRGPGLVAPHPRTYMAAMPLNDQPGGLPLPLARQRRTDHQRDRRRGRGAPPSWCPGRRRPSGRGGPRLAGGRRRSGARRCWRRVVDRPEHPVEALGRRPGAGAVAGK